MNSGFPELNSCSFCVSGPEINSESARHDNPVERAQTLAFDHDLVSYRQTAEWGMRALQWSFGCLRIPLEISQNHRHGNLLEVYLWLHNVRTQVVGINQIKSVYEPMWSAGSQEDI